MNLFSFVLKQKKQKFKAVNHLSAGFSATRHHLNGPSGSQAVINIPAGVKCCQSVAENTLSPPIDSRPEIFIVFVIPLIDILKGMCLITL
jgi:hypothetical protein